MVVTVGLQDISSKYIILETSYVFILNVYDSRIKVTGFCKPKKGVGIQNGRYSRFAGH